MDKLVEESYILEEKLEQLDEIYVKTKNKKVRKIIKELMDNISKNIDLIDKRMIIIKKLI